VREANPSLSARAPFRTALILAVLFAAIAFLIHFLSSLWGSHLGYGFFRDELYFLVCGHRLAWGYVDQPPLVAFQARIAEALFGLSPTGVRVLSFAASGVFVALTGILTWQMGGRRSAQALAMTAVLAAPALLATANYLSMNSFEPCFWMASMLLLLRIADGSARPRAWLLFGLLAGLGIQNKHSTVFFLVAVLIGLLISPQRRILWSKECAAGVSLAVLIATPNLVWQWIHHFPTYELLNNIAHSDKNVRLPPLAFVQQQINMMFPFSAPLWIGGLAWLVTARKSRPWRFAAFTFVLFLALLIALHAKDYYLAPVYPLLFAAGAAALDLRFRRPWLINAYTALIVLSLCFITGPIILTLLPPAQYHSYVSRFRGSDAQPERVTGPLPQYLSDRFGWPEMVEGFANRYNALPASERPRTAIYCSNYGEASAINMLGRKYELPVAISGHQNYFYWGYNGYVGDSVLTLGDKRERYADDYAEVIDLGPFDAPWIMDFEHRHYFWLRHRKRPYSADWLDFKNWY
jgi:hypothetical protein